MLFRVLWAVSGAKESMETLRYTFKARNNGPPPMRIDDSIQVGPVEACDPLHWLCVIRLINNSHAHSSITIDGRHNINAQLSTDRARSDTVDGPT